MGLLDAPTARIILGAAVIDDILGLVVLAVVSSLAASAVNYVEILTTAALAIGFTVFIIVVGAPVINRVAPSADRLRSGHGMFYSWISLVPWFISGSDHHRNSSNHRFFFGWDSIGGSRRGSSQHAPANKWGDGISVPFFLVNIGMQLRLDVFRSSSVIVLCVLVTLVAVATKLLGCGLGALNLGIKRAARVRMGMVPRGEVGIIVAQIGLSLAVIGPELYGVVLFMAVATTLIAPPFLKLLYAGEPAAEAEIGPANAGGILTSEDLCKMARNSPQ